MNPDRCRPVLITGLLAAALILSAVAWQTKPPREPLILSAREGASPSTDPTQEAFRAKVLAWMAGTMTPVPTATRPPDPTPTAPISCHGGLSPGQACIAATLEPTLAPTHVFPPPTPLSEWPGEGLATPGRMYVIGESDE